MKKLIARETENKMVGARIETNVLHNSAIGGADPRAVIPQVTQGVASYQRIGDKIKPKSLVVKGILAPSAEQPDNQPLYVRVLILAQKSIKVGQFVNGGNVNVDQLLRPNSAVAPNDQIAYSGTTHNINDPVNTDLFRVYMDKTILLCPVDQTKSTETLQASVRRWKYTFKKLPSTLSFDEANADWPNNFAPFVAVGYAYADGTSPDVIQLRVNSTIDSYLTFEDA